MLCHKCGVNVPHECDHEQILGAAIQECPLKKGAIWVQVKAGEDEAGGVDVRVAGDTQTTDALGFARFDPLDNGAYQVEVVSVPPTLQSSFALPNPASSNAPVWTGEITFLNFALTPVVTPTIALTKKVVVVGGPRVALTLGAPSSHTGGGTLEVTRGASNIKLYKTSNGGGDSKPSGRSMTFASVPSGGIPLEMEAVEPSDLQGVELRWTLDSGTHGEAGDAATAVVTAAKVELVVETSTNTTLSSEVKTGVGGVVHVQNERSDRKRLQVTPRCEPADLQGQLQLTVTDSADNLRIYDAATKGKLVDLTSPIPVSRTMQSYYVEGAQVSRSAADTRMQLDLVGELDNADHLKLTVVETTLKVYRDNPGKAELPTELLTEDQKLNPGRRLYQQDTEHWLWSRARVEVTKNPADAPGQLELRTSGNDGLRLYSDTIHQGNEDISLRDYVEGEDALTLPIADVPGGSAYWVEGHGLDENPGHELVLDLVDTEKVVDKAVFRVQKPLTEYQRIAIFDMGGPGTGHQAAVVKFLDGLSAIGFDGEVVLTYPSAKSAFYAKKLGRSKDLDSPKKSYEIYRTNWNIDYPTNATNSHKLKILCRPDTRFLSISHIPVEDRKLKFTGSEEGEETFKAFWTQYLWPGSKPEEGDLSQKVEGDGFLQKHWGSKANVNTLARKKATYKRKILEQETSPRHQTSVSELMALDPLSGSRTLTVFAAKDIKLNHGHSDDDALISSLKEKTADTSPAVMLLQPFLWKKVDMEVWHDKKAVALKHEAERLDVKATYRIPPYDTSDDQGKIDAIDKDIVDEQERKRAQVTKHVLNEAKRGNAILISAYWSGQASKIIYPRLLEAMVSVAKKIQLNPHRKIIVTLIGTEEQDAHTNTGRTYKNDSDVFVRTDDTPSPPNTKIELAHVGRTKVMPLFERYSSVFVTEGANTWQELLAMGTPSLSVKPHGNTQPWDDAPPDNGALIKTASEALCTAAEKPNDEGAVETICDFINNALDSGSEVRKYFDQWKELLADRRADQVVLGVRCLPDLRLDPTAGPLETPDDKKDPPDDKKDPPDDKKDPPDDKKDPPDDKKDPPDDKDPPGERREVPGVEFIGQQRSNWCWAATSLMMRKFYLNETITLKNLVKGALGTHLKDNELNEKNALALPGLRHDGREGTVITWNDIKRQIDNDKPFIVGNSGHYFVCYGYEVQGTSGSLLLWDPMGSGSKDTKSYNEYVAMMNSNATNPEDKGTTLWNFRRAN